MKFAAAAAALASSLLAASAAPLSCIASNSIPVARDATILYSGLAQCGNALCSSIPHGLEDTVYAVQGLHYYGRILLGFDLPERTPSQCTLRIPATVRRPDAAYTLTIYSTDSSWDEATVNGSKSMDGTRVASVKVPAGQLAPGSVDVSSACKSAQNGRLSLFVDNDTGSEVAFASIQSGSKQIFTLDYSL